MKKLSSMLDIFMLHEPREELYLRSPTTVKAKGQWTRLILDEEQRSNCFPRAVKASRVSSAQNITKINGTR